MDEKTRKLIEKKLAEFIAPENVVTLTTSKDRMFLFVDRTKKDFWSIALQPGKYAMIPIQCLAGIELKVFETEGEVAGYVREVLIGFKPAEGIMHKPV